MNVEDSTSKVYVEPGGSQPPMGSQNSGAGAQLFVINLCASIAPVSTTGRNIPGLDNYRLYQVARVEDGRTRHRLRLGFFTNEAHAERVLTVVRQQYPTAFTTCLCDEDRRFTRGYSLPENPAPAAPVAAPKRPAVAVVNSAPAPAAAPKPAPAPVQAPVKAAAPVVAPPAAATKPAAAKPAAAPPELKAAAPTVNGGAAKAQPPAAAKPKPKAADSEIVEMTWEPDEETKASASSTRLKALTIPGMDEFSWDDAAPTRRARTPGLKEPLAVGLLSGKFDALATSKFRTATPGASAATASSGKFDALATGKFGAATAATPAATSSSGKFDALATSKFRAAAAAAMAAKAAASSAPFKTAASPPAAAKPVTPPAPVLVPPKLDTAASVRVPALTFSDPAPSAVAAPKSNGPASPYHVGKGLNIQTVDDFELDLTDEPAKQSPAPAATAKTAAPTPTAKPAVTKPAAPVAQKVEPAKPAAPAPAKAAPVAKAATPPVAKPAAPPVAKSAVPVTKPAAPVLAGNPSQAVNPDLDSTQTIRALTNEELNDGAQEKWFAIQLAASEQPVNLDTMPHLDIFEAYRLYSVATAGSGKIVHSLRLGFFKEAVSAEAVTGYLKTFFAAPTVLRISVAEQARFKDAPQPKRAEPVEEPKNNVVDLSNARTTRPVVVPTLQVEAGPSTGAFRPNATGAFTASGSFKAGSPGTFKPGATGAFKPSATGAFKLNSSGVNKAVTPDAKIAAKSATPATKRSEPTRASNTGKHKTLKRSLADELMEEARDTELTESGVRKLPQGGSLLSRLLGKKK